MLTHFYDIESLENVFTYCNFISEDNHLELYYLVDTPDIFEGHTEQELHDLLLDRIYRRNYNFSGTLSIHNLETEEANYRFAKDFGCSDALIVNDPDKPSTYPKEFRIVCDTDPDYDDNIHYYMLGYNSYNYDTTMIACYFYEVFQPAEVSPFGQSPKNGQVVFRPTKASLMRSYNDDLFLPNFKESMPQYLTVKHERNGWSRPDYGDSRWVIRKNMLLTGRHLDVAQLNEKLKKVGLKRLLGMMGYQILESDKLVSGQRTINNLDEFLDLCAYNVSDVVNLDKLFQYKLYPAQFALKKQLLRTYPELVYEKQPDAYAPNISQKTVRKDRLTIDSSSARFSTMALCPYGHLTDIPAVSFDYPSEAKAKELGIKRTNVLEETKKFFYNLFPQQHLRDQFDVIYNFYKSIEGKNVNDSRSYQDDYGQNALPVHKLYDFKLDNGFLPYFDKDGNPTSCIVNFSVGGIHGAEYNKVRYDHDLAEWQKEKDLFEYAKSVYPNAVDLKTAKQITLPDGSTASWSRFLKSGATQKNAEYKDIDAKKPKLFTSTDDESGKLHKKYTYTSADAANHEDFTSYYPNLLRMMDAFYNTGLGYDRYAEIFQNKQDFGKWMKNKSIEQTKRDEYGVMREGTKLILNSASGAAAATFENTIRVNNQILSMRIIGQLFSYRIGQAQTYAGARITSTNTDGLYSVMEETLNNQILAQESATIGVEIEPEPIFLISKDANNRLEYDIDTGVIKGANGGSLKCRKGPEPTNSLAHPAIIDWALAEYLKFASQHYNNCALDKPFDDVTGRQILQSATMKFDAVEFLRMFQNVIASSIGSVSYVFGTNEEHGEEPIILSHYNRVFIMKDGTPDTMQIQLAHARKITPATQTKRKRNNERAIQHNLLALDVLAANGVDKCPDNTEAALKVFPNINSEWSMFVQNKDLHYLTQKEFNFIFDHLDYDKYLELLKKAFEDNWMNEMPKTDDMSDDAGESTAPADGLYYDAEDGTSLRISTIERMVAELTSPVLNAAVIARMNMVQPDGTVIEEISKQITDPKLAEQIGNLLV